MDYRRDKMETKPTIEILDVVHCKADLKARELLLPILKYESTMWKKTRYGGRSPKIVSSHLITGRQGTAGTFLTGLLPRIKKELGDKISIVGQEEKIIPNKKAHVPGIVFRPDQSKALRKARITPRGKIVFPTGSGKTIIALGIMSMFLNYRILFLCHTTDLINQTKIEIEKRFDSNFYIIGAGYKTKWEKFCNLKEVIVLSTIQSFSNIPSKKYSAFFDLVIIDEEHHLNSLDSQYGKAMSSNLAPRRYGLTATESTGQKEKLINEGLLGPVISELTIQEGIKKKIVAKPEIKLVPVPFDPKIKIECKNKYVNYYQYGVIENEARNSLIVNEVQESLKKKEIVLIIIERTEHGRILKKMLKYKHIKVRFVYGATDKEVRTKIKERLKSGKLRVAICSRIWKEGTNIPSLNKIINACGGKEEKGVIQSIGRGLRITENKTTVKLVDMLDPYPYLAEHAIERIQVYINQGWI